MPRSQTGVSDPIIISFYAEKGGVGKTTCTVGIAWELARIGKKVLVVDCDGQRSLTKWIFSDEIDRKYDGDYDKFVKETTQADANTLYSLYLQLSNFKSAVEKVKPGTCVRASNSPNGNVFVLCGDRHINDFDSDITLCENMIHQSKSNIYTGAPYHAIVTTAQKYQVDFVLLDLNPVANALTRCLVMSSHYLIVPTIPDFFSKEMLGDLGKMLIDWHKSYETSRLIASKSFHPLPLHHPKFLGYMVMRFSTLCLGNMRYGLAEDILPINESLWLSRLQQAADASYQKLLNQRRSGIQLVLPRRAYGEANRSLCLGMIRDFHQLGDLSNYYHIPVAFLQEEQVKKLERKRDGRIVAVNQSSHEHQSCLYRIRIMKCIFQSAANTMLSLISQNHHVAGIADAIPSAVASPSLR